MEYIIDDEYGGIPDYEKYRIEDTPETELEWRSLQSALMQEIGRHFPKFEQDADLAPWHDEVRSVFMYLYAERLYNAELINCIQRVLSAFAADAFVRCECYNAPKGNLVGDMMIFPKRVVFSGRAARKGFVDRFELNQ